MKRLTAALLSAAFAAAVLSGCGGTDPAASSAPTEIEAQTWQITCVGGEDSVAARAADKFAQLISENTNGAIRVECVPADGGADSPQEGIRALMDGRMDLAFYSNLDYAVLDPRFEAVSLPFLFDSAENAAEKLDGEGGKALSSVLEEYNLHCLGMGEDGFRCPTNSRRELAAPEDLRGLKLRVTDSRVIQRSYELWNADAATAEWPMVFTALQTGNFDGQENPLSTANAASIQDIQKHVTHWNGFYESLFFCMNGDLYSSLPDDLRSIVDQCGADTIVWQRQAAREEEQSILAAWAGAHVTVTELTDEAAQAFRKAAQPCYDEFAQDVSEELLGEFTGE